MLRRAWTLVVGGGLAAISLSGEPAPVPSPTPDWIVTLSARKALWNDATLAELNLGVRVKDGEALVWGPVLDAKQAAEAVARLKMVPGVNAVVNELFVLPANDLLRRKFAPPDKMIVAAPVALGTQREPAVRAMPSSPVDLIEDVRRSDGRFHNFLVTVTQGIAEIEGANDQVAAAAFTERIRKLPGVTGVRFRPQ